MSALSSVSSVSSLLGGATLNVNGLASGLDSAKIIDGLLAIDQQRITTLQSRQGQIAQQQTAFKAVEARVLALRSSIGQLARTSNSAFDVRQATSSDENLVTAAASASATAGNYQLRVNTVAQAQQIASQGFDSSTSTITQGTLEIHVGAGASATITIGSNNNTVQGLAAAINDAGVGVTANLINDGSGSGTQPYRVVLTSHTTGAANTISITNNLAADNGGAVRPVFDSTYVGAANLSAGYTGTAAVTSNRGAGNFTGSSNTTYRFTVLTDGAVGTDDDLQIGYTDASGAHAGTITVNAADVGVAQTVAEGIQVQFGAGTLVAGQTFTIDGFVPTVQQAKDASITLGAGVGALTVASASNQIDGLFGGITVDLHAADPDTPVTISVANDTNQIQATIRNFVDTYNGLMNFIDQQVQYDSVSQQGGPLLGNRQVIDIQDQVRRLVSQPVNGLKPQMNRLSALGITTDDDGKLTVDSDKLTNALSGDLAGVTLDDVHRLFALTGTSSMAGIAFSGGTAKTVASGTTYQVVVTQAAEQASILATNTLADTTNLTWANNTFTISVDGVSSDTVTLAAGNYSRTALALALQAQINADPHLTARQVTVGLNSNRLTITSNSFGSGSKVTIGTGTALAPLGLAGTETDQGQNVLGHYVVNGNDEPATGTGQILTGVTTNSLTSGLQTKVTLTTAQVGGGVSADVTPTRGLASGLDTILAGMLDPISGRLQSIDDGFNAQIDNLKTAIARQNDSMASKRDELVQRFVALETTINQLQGLGNYLTTQFTQLNNLNASKR